MPIINLINWDENNASMVVSQYLRMKYCANVQNVSPELDSETADGTQHDVTRLTNEATSGKATFTSSEIPPWA